MYIFILCYRLHYAIQTYQEILEYIKAMAHSKDTDLQDNAKIMQHNVFYHSEYRDLFITLLRNYNPKHSSRDLLKDMVQTLHLYLSLLEKFNRRRGCMVVQGKRKKKTAKKSVPKSATASTVSPVRSGCCASGIHYRDVCMHMCVCMYTHVCIHMYVCVYT